MTRIYRDVIAGATWIERGTGTPICAIDDHGAGVGWQWKAPDPGLLVYDDTLHAVENETIDAALADERKRITDAVTASSVPATAKATIRKIIGEVPE